MNVTRAARAALAILMAGCASAVRTAPSLAPCPAAKENTRQWRVVTDSAGVRFRIPPTFVEGPSGDGARRWHPHGDLSEYILAGFIPSSSPVEAMGRAPAPGMREMAQCVDSIAGHQVLVQAWRTTGGTFRDGQRQDRYDVFAVAPVGPELRFYIVSGSYRRQTQRMALAVVRTIQISTP